MEVPARFLTIISHGYFMEWMQIKSLLLMMQAKFSTWFSEPLYYYQAALVLVAFIVVYALSQLIRHKITLIAEPEKHISPFSRIWFIKRSGRLLYPIFAITILAIAVSVSQHIWGDAVIVKAMQRAAIVWLLWVALKAFVTNPLVRTVALWVLVPAALLQLFGLFELVVEYLDGYGFTIGEVDITAYTIVKAVLFGSVLLWIGKLSSQTGERYIRKSTSLDRSTKELLIKLFDIFLYAVLFFITLNLLGIDLTALAVFSGALGVGLGFGLQKIASNFVSGLILLTEKSINIGNLIEMNDGIFGYVRKLGARASIVETFDGKEVMVPNEDFITSRVSNLTYSNTYGRVDIPVGVDYETDLDLAYKLILEAANEYPNAIKDIDDYSPSCFLREFGDSSVNFLLIFWLEDVTHGRWKAQSDVMFSIWRKLKENHITIPFPQRDLHIRSGLEPMLKTGTKKPSQK